ncbi:hypothetical protein ACCO45_001325 [Purpureocillium lilacinum]|uniref:Uncharacterized protein n=1 Tax=Purpureocillium lilacinum TaxID=33203 RepID=A0ACC4E6P7_PURLI
MFSPQRSGEAQSNILYARNATFAQQLVVVALLEELALAEHKDDVCVLHRRQAMSHHHHRAALACAFKRRLNQFLALRIERARGLV